MVEKLRKIMKHEGINSSKLAEMLGIQASGISHIMSGRNKPSLDFIQKLLNRFPQINSDWLLRDKGPMYQNEVKTKSSPATSTLSMAEVSPLKIEGASSLNLGEDLFSASGDIRGGEENRGSLSSVVAPSTAVPSGLERDDNDIIPNTATSQKDSASSVGMPRVSESAVRNLPTESTIERIVIFFRNKTFAEYHPE
jgi:transcriptional regulator with XRE-family HTH domain